MVQKEQKARLLLRLRGLLLNAVGLVAEPHGQGWAGLCPAPTGLAVGIKPQMGWDFPHGEPPTATKPPP